MITKKEVTKLSYEITGFAIKVYKNSGQDYLKGFINNVKNLSWKEMDMMKTTTCC